jgi:hypothetical protein
MECRFEKLTSVIVDACAASKALQRSKNKTTREANNRKKFFSIGWA